MIAAAYDGRRMGALIDLLRPPLRETSFWGMTIQAGADLRAFLTMRRSARSLAHVTMRVGRHLWDLARHGRAMQLRNGQALVARLMVAARDAGGCPAAAGLTRRRLPQRRAQGRSPAGRFRPTGERGRSGP